MLKKNLIVSFTIINLLTFNLKALDAKSILKSTLHWTISAGPTWSEASSYISLLSDKNTFDLIGDEDFSSEESKKIKDYLNKKICFNWNKIPIKVIKEDLRVNVPYSMICSDSIIFVNPDIYDLINQEEKNQEILQIGTLISNRHTLSTGIFLSALPIITHFGCKVYTNIIKKIYKQIPKKIKNYKTKLVLKTHNFVANSCLFKLLINKLLTKAYFKYKEQKYNKLIENRLSRIPKLNI